MQHHPPLSTQSIASLKGKGAFPQGSLLLSLSHWYSVTVSHLSGVRPALRSGACQQPLFACRLLSSAKIDTQTRAFDILLNLDTCSCVPSMKVWTSVAPFQAPQLDEQQALRGCMSPCVVASHMSCTEHNQQSLPRMRKPA